MKASKLLAELEKIGIDTITGVPDSTLKQFCDCLQTYEGNLKHYVTANEGAAVGMAIGSHLASGKPACVYMQNSGIGNAVNPLASLANEEVYGIPLFFIVGWRGEPGTKDEPQHVFQGKITCELFDVLNVPYRIVEQDTTEEELLEIMLHASETLKANRQFALIVKKNTFEKEASYAWDNGNPMTREIVLESILKAVPGDTIIVSTTGKISRELYEQSDKLYGHHNNIFMTVGGMGHASMIALGIAMKRPDKKVLCIDGDGAALMHMGAMPFIASLAPKNFYHVVINNRAHESVGAMPTGCQETDFALVAKVAGYLCAEKIETIERVNKIGDVVLNNQGPILFEIPVSLVSRPDLIRPKESARENKDNFMKTLNEYKPECDRDEKNG